MDNVEARSWSPRPGSSFEMACVLARKPAVRRARRESVPIGRLSRPRAVPDQHPHQASSLRWESLPAGRLSPGVGRPQACRRAPTPLCPCSRLPEHGSGAHLHARKLAIDHAPNVGSSGPPQRRRNRSRGKNPSRRLRLGGSRAPARDSRPASGLTDEGQQPLQLARRTFKFASCRAVLNGEDLAEGEHGVGIVATWHRFAPRCIRPAAGRL
jgi:hypothetical protein